VKRTILPDARYDSQTVLEVHQRPDVQGKKSTAERIFYAAMDLVENRTSQPGVNIFKQALTNLKPVVEVKSRRVGGATYQVPVEVRPERRTALAMRWLISYSRDRNEKSMAEKLAAEVIAASKGEGNAVKKKEDTHRMADANKAFAHYRWVAPSSPSQESPAWLRIARRGLSVSARTEEYATPMRRACAHAQRSAA
jgi:small subunit ribosomal protein S7